LVKQAFDKLDVNKNGAVQLDDIASLYDATSHPDVVSGKKSPDQVFQEFMMQWDGNGDGSVSFEEFLDYFGGVSSSIDSDEYFETMMKKAWQL